MGKKQYPNYVKPRGKNALRFRRRITGSTDYFTRALRAKQDSPASEIQREAASILALFEAEVRLRSATHPDSLSDVDLDMAAANFLSKHAIQPGQFSQPEMMKDPMGSDVDIREFHAEEVLGIEGFLDDMRWKGRSDDGSDWTPEEEKQWAILDRAREAVLKPRHRAPRYLSAVLRWYANNRGKGKPSWQTEGRNWDRIERRFKSVLAVIGDCLTEDGATNRAINKGLREYAQHEAERGLAGQSIERNMRETIAAFRRVSDVYELDWRIKTPETNPQAERQRVVLTPPEMESVLLGCLAEPGHVSAVILAAIHGMIPSEIGNLEEDDIRLNERIPYLRVTAGKTTERRRLVPIVVGLSVLRASVTVAAEWVRATSDSTPSATTKKRLMRWTGNSALTLYCLRHTWNDWAAVRKIPLDARAYIGGWRSAERDSSFSKRLIEYGLDGLEGYERIKVLQDAQASVLSRLVELEKNQPKDNVVSFRS